MFRWEVGGVGGFFMVLLYYFLVVDYKRGELFYFEEFNVVCLGWGLNL